MARRALGVMPTRRKDVSVEIVTGETDCELYVVLCRKG
jgi:hypothetical protein